MRFPDEKRLADLIWRSFKLKVVVLVAALVCLQLISSALSNARMRVQEINERSVQARLQWFSKSPAAAPKNPALFDPTIAAIADEAELRLYGLFLPMIPSSADPKSQGKIDLLQSRYRELESISAERESTYNLEFGLPYLKSNVLVSALFLIDLWPVLLILTFAIVVAISMRQRSYEIVLSKMIHDSGGAKEKAVQASLTGYLAGELRARTLEGKRVLLYVPSLILLPEPFITLCLLVVILVRSAYLPGTDMPSAFQLRSILVGYHSVIVCLIALLIFALTRTKSYYGAMARAATGSQVLGRFGFHAAKLIIDVKAFCSKENVQRFGARILATVTLGSLFLPWVGNWGILGFQLLLPQTPISQTGKTVFYRIEPSILLEMRAQLVLALVFVVLMLFGTLLGRHATNIRRISQYLSLAVLVLVANFLVYLLLLSYTQERQLVSALFFMFLGPGGNVDGPHGLPLVFENPMYGFFVFVLTLVMLCILAWAKAPVKSSR